MRSISLQTSTLAAGQTAECLSSWAAAMLDQVRLTDPAGVSELLQAGVTGVEERPGYTGLERSDKELLAALARGEQVDLNRSTLLLQLLSGELFRQSTSKAPFARIVKTLGGPEAEEMEKVEEQSDKAPRRYARETSPTLSNGESVLGAAFRLAWQKICQHFGINLPEEAHPSNEPGIHTIHKTRHVHKLERPESIEEGRALYEQHNAAAIQETDFYYEAQLRGMTGDERKAYLKAAEKVTSLADAYADKTQEVLDICHRAGGRPSHKPMNDAYTALQEEIYNSPYLQAKNIDPQVLFVLWERRRMETWVGDQKEYEFLRWNAIMTEGNYVCDTIAAQVTEQMAAGVPEAEWQHLDKLGAYAKELYKRLASGGKGAKADQFGSDMEDLAFFREHYFPYQNNNNDPTNLGDLSKHRVDWNSKEMRKVNHSLDKFHQEMADYKQASKAYHTEISLDAFEWDVFRRKVSLQRDQTDMEFQMVRLQEQYGHLKKRLDKAGKELSEDEEKYFDEYMKDIEKRVENVRNYTRNLCEKLDDGARETRRNSLNKGVARILGMRLNLFLEDMYQLHFPQEYQETLERERAYRKDPSQKPPDAEEIYRPTWISFGYNRLLRGVDDAIVNGTISNDHVRGYLDSFLDAVATVHQQLGLRIAPGGGRKLVDRQRIHQMEAKIGLSSEKTAKQDFVLYGFANASMIYSDLPHKDLKLSDPFNKVYPPGLFKRLQRWPIRKIVTANHSGISEFLLVIAFRAFGFPAPQVMQQGAANVPLAGEHAAAMSGVLDRALGAEGVTELLLENARMARPILQYRGGTRAATYTAFDPFIAPMKTVDGQVSYAGLHAHQITTDFMTSGLTTKLTNLWAERAGGTNLEMFITSFVHEELYTEPTWNLDDFRGAEAILRVLLDNTATDIGINLKPNKPRRIALAGIYSAGSFLTEEEIRALPDQDRVQRLFTHPWHGIPMTERQSYFSALQVGEAIAQLDQVRTASGMNLSAIPDQTLGQKRLAEEISHLSYDEQQQRTVDPLFDPMRDRLKKAGLDHESGKEVPARSKERHPLAPVSDEAQERLNKALPRNKAEQAIRGLLEMLKSRVKKGPKLNNAVDHLIEMAQRGASYGKRMKDLGRNLAIDGDSVLWDHIFEVEGKKVPEALRKRLIDHLSNPGNTVYDATRLLDEENLDEVINILPTIVAFLHGYRAATGEAPTIFSSTEANRFLRIAQTSETNPMARELFKALLGIDLSKLSNAQIHRRINQAIRDKKIITRTQIADHVVHMMDRYRQANYDLDSVNAETGEPVFNDIEKQDIITMLKSNGDCHFKYRSLFAYDELIDDRDENCQQAAAYRRHYQEEDNPRVTRVYQPKKPFASSPLQQYFSFKLGTNSQTDARLNRARDGMMAQVLRDMEEVWAGPWDPQAAYFVYDRKQAPLKVDGLRDVPFATSGSLRAIRLNYEGPQEKATDVVQAAKTELLARAAIQEKDRQVWIQDLIDLYRHYRSNAHYGADANFEEGSPEQVMIDGACDFLEPPDGKPMKPITWKNRDRVLQPTMIMKDPRAIQKAKDLVAKLEDSQNYIDQKEALKPDRKSGDSNTFLSTLPKQILGILLYIGELAQHGMGDHVNDSLPVEKETGALAYGYHWLKGDGDRRALLTLARALSDRNVKLSNDERAQGYGVAIQQFGASLFLNLLGVLSENDLVDDSTRDQLKDQRPQLEKRVQAANTHVRHAAIKGIKEVPDLQRRAELTGGMLAPFFEQDGLIRNAVNQFITGAIVQYINDVQEQQAANGLRVENTGRGDGFRMADLILFGGIRLFGASSKIGKLMRRARVRLHELGWERAANNLFYSLEAVFEKDGGLTSRGLMSVLAKEFFNS